MANIIERFLIHVTAATSLVLAVELLLAWIARQRDEAEAWYRRALPGLLVAAVAFTREAYDVSRGQPLLKAFTDYASWIIGVSASVYAIYRIRNAQR